MAGTLVANTINTDTGLFSTQNAYLGIAKAWVLYNGVAQTITGSFNVSSVTYNGTGNYTVNFTTAMPNNTYGMCGSAGTAGTGNISGSVGVNVMTTSSIQVSVVQHNIGLVDRQFVTVATFSS